jgi:hypothetical protein
MIHAVVLGKNHGLINRTRINKKAALTMLRLLRYYLLTSDLRRIRMFVRLVTQTLIRNPQYLEAVLMHLVVYKHLKLFYEQGTGETMLKS